MTLQQHTKQSMTKIIRNYGSWRSSIDAKNLVNGQINSVQIQYYNGFIYWLEPRPEHKGRMILARRLLSDSDQSNGIEYDLLAQDKSVRSQVHEYGGSAYRLCGKGIVFVNHSDQQLYLQGHDGEYRAITKLKDHRFVDIKITADDKYLICVCEIHYPDAEATNSLVSVNLDTGESTTLASGEDFYASPDIFTDDKGSKLCWISWSHPDMPWDHTRLWTAHLHTDGSVKDIECIRDNANESIFQPLWSPDGQLFFVSDISGWWNIYSSDQSEQAIVSMPVEFGLPQWVFGMSTYGFIDRNTIACSYIDNGRSHLATINIKLNTISPIDTDLNFFEQICTADNNLFFIAASAYTFPAIYCYSLVQKNLSQLSPTDRWQPDPKIISKGRTICFETSDQQQAHAFYYEPVNPDFAAPSGELPPLIVMSHGGPTAFSNNSLSLKVQFWTSRGFAVCDVNYRGSTGYGRRYRDALKQHWGIYDVDDCVNAARNLVENKLVDPNKLAIRGGSAGGYSVLCALTFHDTFKAGASYYGISDLSVLAKDTHKFEARYLDRLVGPWPKARELYTQRSPINAVDKLACPVIFFQGLQDKVVPPNQAEMMVQALRDKKLPVAHVTYEKEQHGFRQADTIVHSLETELRFYGMVFGFEPSDECEIVHDEIQSFFYNISK